MSPILSGVGTPDSFQGKGKVPQSYSARSRITLRYLSPRYPALFPPGDLVKQGRATR